MRTLKKTLAVAVLAATLVPMPARAAEASCGGLSPLELTCEAAFVPQGSTVEVTVTTDVTFVGLIEIRFQQDGGFSRSLPCVQASVATEPCVGQISGEYEPGRTMTMSAEVFSYEGITPSIGAWDVTALG